MTQPTLTAPLPPVPVARTTVTLTIALALALTGRGAAAVVVGAVAIALAQLDVLRPSVTRPIHAAIGAASHAVGTFITVVGVTLAEALVVLPAALLTRVAGIDPLRRSAHGRPRWRPAERGDLPGRSFTREARRPKRREVRRQRQADGPAPRAPRRHVPARAVVLGLALVAVLAVALGRPLFERYRQAPQETASGINVIDTAALRDQPFADETGKETGEAWLGFRYSPYLELTLDDYHGRFVNVTKGERRTWQAPVAAGTEPLDVLFLGGSTTFGAGLRDDHTIPSEFAKAAAAAGIPVRVKNYGVPGYTNYQETLLLARLLAEGARPDVVVMYDGFNDTNLALAKWFVDGTRLGEPSHMFADDFTALLEDKRSQGWGAIGLPAPPSREGERKVPDADALIANVADTYEQGLMLARSLSTTYGFTFLPYWQPNVFDKPLDAGDRDMLAERGFDPFLTRSWQAISRDVRDDLPAGTTDLGDALDEVPTPVFFDTVHSNEVAADWIGRAMVTAAAPRLREATPR